MKIFAYLLLVGLLVEARYENINVKQDWWQNAVFYQIYPRSFMDSDGDGIGDINGITSKIEYLKDLGVDAAWLSPIFKSPMHDFGYDVSDYYSIQPEYGTMEDFEQLLKKANELNMKIILDFVPNHTSNESEWFIKSSNKDEYYSDWYIWENGHLNAKGQRSPPNNWISVFRKSAWHYKATRDQYYLHQFGSAQPDLNYRNPVVVEEMKNNVDGSVHEYKNAVRYYGRDIHPGAHIPLNFVLIKNLNKESDARDIKYAIDRWLTYKPLSMAANWMTGNHDKSRVASRFRPELVDAFNMLVLLLPGVAFTYMGEEIGMVNGFVPWVETKDPLACNTDDPINFVEVSRDPVRTPFQWNNGKNAGFSKASKTWLPIADGYEHINVAKQRAAVRSHLQVYRSLTTIRMRPAFRLGRYESLALNSKVLAFKRWYNDDAYIVVMNVGKTYQVVDLTAFDLIFGHLEVEISSVVSSRSYGDTVQATHLDLAADESLVLRMQV